MDILRIECLLYNVTSSGRHKFFLSYLSTLEITSLFDETIALDSLRLFARSPVATLDENVSSTFKTLKDFSEFFINHPEYHIHDFDVELSNGITIASHDDGEVHITLAEASNDMSLLERILYIKGLPTSLLEKIMTAPGFYFKIAPNGDILGFYGTFDEYLESFY
jgi:hypothetical protein